MSGFSLRPAFAADQETINSFIRSAGLNPLGLRWKRFVVASDANSRVIACAQLKPHSGGALEFASLVVSPEWRGRGVARALIGHLKRKAKPPIYLMCRSDLVGFYRLFGFREVEHGRSLPGYFRWVRRLSQLFFWLLPGETYLAIMCWQDS